MKEVYLFFVFFEKKNEKYKDAVTGSLVFQKYYALHRLMSVEFVIEKLAEVGIMVGAPKKRLLVTRLIILRRSSKVDSDPK